MTQKSQVSTNVSQMPELEASVELRFLRQAIKNGLTKRQKEKVDEALQELVALIELGKNRA